MGLFDKFAESIESARQNALAISRRNQLQAQEAQRAYDDTVELRSLLDNARPTMAPSTRPEALATDRAMNELSPVRAAMAEQFPALTRPMDEQAPNYDKITYDFLQRRNPVQAQTFAQNVITQAQNIAKAGDHEGAINHVNNVLGTDMTYLGSKDNVLSIANGDGTHILYDFVTGKSQEIGRQKPLVVAPGSTLYDPAAKAPIFTAENRPEKGFDTIDMGDKVKVIPRDGSDPYYEKKNLTPSQAVRIQVAGTGSHRGGGSGKAPSGYRWTEYGDLEPIPGGPADMKMGDKEQGRQGAIQSMDTTISTLRDLMSHPGKGAATGGSSMFNRFAIPGTDRRGFLAKLETFQSQLFLPMVQQLRGMGALSDAEGKKLTQAAGALDPTMPEAEFNRSLQNLLRELQAKRGLVERRGSYTPVTTRNTAPSASRRPAPKF